MDKDICINKVLRDLKLQELISKDISGEIRSGEARRYLEALWVAGMEYGLSICNKNQVIQCDKYGVKIKQFDNITDAGKKTGEKVKTIYEAIRRKHSTRLGFKWKYADNEKE
jgi:hypothetical protein